VIGFPALASAAYMQGRAAGLHILGHESAKTLAKDIPTGIYTSPEISSVGPTERELTAAGVPYEIGHAQFRSLARAQITGQTVGMLKLLFHRETMAILAVHCFGANASEIVHIGQAIMAQPPPNNTLMYFINGRSLPRRRPQRLQPAVLKLPPPFPCNFGGWNDNDFHAANARLLLAVLLYPCLRGAACRAPLAVADNNARNIAPRTTPVTRGFLFSQLQVSRSKFQFLAHLNLKPETWNLKREFAMIVVMEKAATPEQIRHMAERVESLGLKAHIIQGTERTVIAAIGEKRDGTKESLASGPGVEDVVPILAPYKVASREVKKEPTQVVAGSLKVGAGTIGIIAGPCSVENEEQILTTARAVKAAGGTALRGGAFKPRTSPYSFQGLKEEGLKLLAAARQETGLAIVTEVMATEDVALVAEYADVLQVGARNMQNYRLLEAVGQAKKPVLLKRGPSATIEELLLAAEYILNEGNPNVMLCERGIRTFESHTRFTLPLATVPYLHHKTHLPIVVDPSHGTGHTYLVPDMAVASIAAGADGLILEIHPDPERALSDGYQSLNFPQFLDTLARCRAVAAALGKAM
jgi:3-deoxy-7-phosphoheptulonate synthase